MSKVQKSTKVKGLFCAQSFTTYLQSKGYSPSTQLSYVAMTQRFSRWLIQQDLEADQATYNDIMAYVKYLKNNGNVQHTIAQNINAVKLWFRSLIKTEQLTNNPAAHIGLQKRRQQVLYHILKPEEMELMYREYTTDRLITKRNKIILGLLIYQGLTTTELSKLRLEDIHVEQGTITIKEGRKFNGRTLQLQAHQILSIHDYILNTRGQILSETNKTTDFLIVTTGTGHKIYNVLARLTKYLKNTYPEVESLKQLRASVITAWVKQYNLREAQYRAGHRYVSSTEKYRANDIETLEDKLKQYRPQVIPTDSGGN